jgi:hypothetical protein
MECYGKYINKIKAEGRFVMGIAANDSTAVDLRLNQHPVKAEEIDGRMK